LWAKSQGKKDIDEVLAIIEEYETERQFSSLKTEWGKQLLLTIDKYGGVSLSILRKATKKDNSFWKSIINRLIEKRLIRVLNEKEKLEFMQKYPNFFRNLAPYHVRQIKIYGLTEKGKVFVEKLKEKRGENNESN